jgi:isochorismate synthase EntC
VAQERDPRAYQLALRLPGGAAFVASTPEQLYVRNGAAVASEAVAGTRARGPAGVAAAPPMGGIYTVKLRPCPHPVLL